MKKGKTSRRGALLAGAWFLASGLLADGTGGAGMLLESGLGVARIWRSPAAAVAVPLARGRIARVAAAAEGGFLVAGEELSSNSLFFVRAVAGEVTDLPLPVRVVDGVQARPVLLTRRGDLDGAVWLEGSPESGFAVVAAPWNGTSWEATEVAVPANGRPQLAPSGVVLEDGSWLVAWAGFDGEDDEVFWSRRIDGIWSTPRRIHRDNRVPDLLPALIAEGSGAIAAWSVYDGNDYRVSTARFEAGRWLPGAMLEELGPEDVAWQRSHSRAFVVYRSVVPEGWNAVELATDGGVLHRINVSTTEARPPLVKVDGWSDAPRFVWPNGRAEKPR